MNFILHVLILVLIYAIAASSLDLVAGHAGLLSLSHAAFFGLGAYVAALLGTNFGFGFLVTSCVAVALGAAGSLLLSLTSLRLHEDYFVLGSFALSQVAYSIAVNWIDVTGGARGVSNVPALSLLGERTLSHTTAAGLTLLLALAILALFHRVVRGAFGRAIHAVREDELLAEAYGKNTFRLKVEIFGLSCGMSAMAGSLLAHYIGFVDPSLLNPSESIGLLAMVVIGGAGGRWGAPLGAAVVVGLPEALRLLGLPGAASSNVKQILYGCLLTSMMLFRPRGVLGKYDFSRF